MPSVYIFLRGGLRFLWILKSKVWKVCLSSQMTSAGQVTILSLSLSHTHTFTNSQSLCFNRLILQRSKQLKWHEVRNESRQAFVQVRVCVNVYTMYIQKLPVFLQNSHTHHRHLHVGSFSLKSSRAEKLSYKYFPGFVYVHTNFDM